MFTPKVVQITPSGNLVVYFGCYFTRRDSLRGSQTVSYFGEEDFELAITGIEKMKREDLVDIIFQPTYRVITPTDFQRLKQDLLHTGVILSEAIHQHTLPHSNFQQTPTPPTPDPGGKEEFVPATEDDIGQWCIFSDSLSVPEESWPVLRLDSIKNGYFTDSLNNNWTFCKVRKRNV